jgi:hypothetical protein
MQIDKFIPHFCLCEKPRTLLHVPNNYMSTKAYKYHIRNLNLRTKPPVTTFSTKDRQYISIHQIASDRHRYADVTFIDSSKDSHSTAS